MKRIPRVAALVAAIAATAAAQPAGGSAATNLLSRVTVKSQSGYENLTLFPLVGPASTYSSYTLLDDAIRSGQVEVKEKDGGQVNTVRVKNTGKTYVFGMAGEIVSGAKQDRMLRDDVLLSPGSGWLDVPVYCTEHGRWAGSSMSFGTKGYVASGAVRGRAAKSQSQDEVWAEVDAAHNGLGVAAESRAFARVYEDKAAQEQARPYYDQLDRLPELCPGALGVLVAVGSRIICVDAFGSPALFRKMWPKLLRSYVIDAMQSRPVGSIGQKQAQQFIQTAARATVTDQPSVGAGRLQRLSALNGSGSALVFRSSVVHLDLFPGGNCEIDDGSVPPLDFRRQRTLH
ncbi:hypothetical protein FJY68_06640 [candidate division WOR-3 bacterium]|uniref:ARG and Rhodanese-Phosphatase-superfamily-associated domain-containing protein n=1 Tax=candidate division WOR-3 bacterium TaxID=2052148 RepID=A0A938BRD3_UNCW3|nr:hypothetical protein [candidate division WOR-3 bacterium]